MKKINDNSLKEYAKDNSDNKSDLYDYLDSIGGTLSKKFVMIDSSKLTKYFDIVAKGNSNYLSYLDDLIKSSYNPKIRDENNKKVLPIKYASVLIKDMSTHKNYNSQDNEVTCSQLANLFDVKTVYNTPVLYNDNKCVVSLDFLKDGETFESLDNLIEENLGVDKDTQFNTFDEFLSLRMWLDLLEKAVKPTIKTNDPKTKDNILKQLKEDFAIQAFFKSFILGEEDFRSYNFGVVYSRNYDDAKLSPCFDYEFCNTATFKLDTYLESCCNYLHTMLETMPERTKAFMDNMNNVIHNKKGNISFEKIEKILYDTQKDSYGYNRNLSNIKESLKRIFFVYNELIKNNNVSLSVDKLVDMYKNTPEKSK